MGRRDLRKPSAGASKPAAVAPALREERQDQVLRRLQERFGNQVAERLLLEAPSDAFELYLSDLVASERSTGADFSAYLPGQAPQEWARFAQAWYRVLWAERQPESPVVESLPDLEPAPLEAVGTPAESAAGPSQGGDAPAEAPRAGSEGTSVAFGGLAMRRAAADEGVDLEDPVAIAAWFETLQQRTSAGRPLTEGEQAFMERVHGDPLRDARVHEGAAAQEAAADIGARAFTIDQDIWLGERADLGTRGGARLLAHEATHVLQNRAGRGASATTSVSEPGQPLELEAETAERAADHVWEERKAAWAFIPPSGLDSRGQFLADWMLGRLPSTANEAPDELVREGLRALLAQRAHRRLGEARLTLTSGLAGDVARDDEAATLAELDALARKVTAAQAERDGLLFLVQVSGAPAREEFLGLQESFAPYPSFSDQLERTLTSLRREDPVTEVVQEVGGNGAGELEIDAERGRQTLRLVRQLAPQLGLSASAVEVHTDEAAAAQTRALGTRGLAEDGAIHLDADAFQPGTADARGLVAHELTHLAQEGLAPADHVSPGLVAEAEAADVAWRAASGGHIEAPSFGLPTGHVAAEGSVDASGILATLTTANETVTAAQGSVSQPTGGPAGGQDPNASEDSERKLEQYEDGVDGVCEMIEDLDAFDDLCDAIDDEEPTQGHLNRVMANEHAARLPKMWQGALEGGEVAGQMQRAFNEEFDGRGFWEETELAFEMICRTAKSMARPEPEAAAARQEAANAEGEAANAEREANASGEAGGDAAGGAGGAEVGAVDPALAQYLGASVEEVAPAIPSFDTLRTVTDGQFAAITDATEHRAAFCASPPDIEQGRGGQVMEALFENLIGSGSAAFTDQLVDGLIWDNVGKLGDLAVSGLTKGKLGTPFVGPIIQLAQNPPWTAGAWGFGEGGPFTNLAQGWDNLGNTLDAFNSAESAGDYIGIFCALLADIFGMLRDLIDGICTVLSTLSALCYVVGGILIIVGIALLWLAGVGAPLVSAGGWLTRMGGILGRINTVLEPVVILLSGLTMVFRTIAALLVPSDLYAQQLQGVGEDASNFGEKGGAKLGDMAAERANEAIAAPFQSRTSDPGDTDSAQGSEGEALAGDIDTTNQADLDRVADEAQTALDDEARAMGEDVPTPDDDTPAQDDDTPAQDDDDTRQQDDDPDADGTNRPNLLRRIADRIPVVNTAVQGVQDGWNDAKQGFSDPARFAQEGLNPQLRAYVDGQMSERITTLADRARDLRSQIDAINNDPDGDLMQAASLQADLNATNQRIVDLHGDITRQRDLIQDIERQERAAAELPDNREALEEAEAAQRRAEEAEAAKQREIDSANEQLRTAEETLRQQQDAATEHTADSEHAAGDVTRHQTEAADLTTQATDLTTQAADIDRARALQPAADTARSTADDLRSDLVGRTTSVEIDGASRDRRVSEVRVNDDGSISLQVEKTRGSPDPQWVDAGDIRQDRFQNEVRAAETAERDASTRQTEIDGILEPYGGDNAEPADLRQQATGLTEQAATERENQAHAQEQVDRLAGSTPPTPDENPVTDARNRITTLQGELTTLQEQTTAAQQATETARAAATGTPQEESIARHQEHVQYQDGRERTAGEAFAQHLTSTSSGNAMGGTGSAYKDLGGALSSWAIELSGVMSIFPTEITQSAHTQQQQQQGGGLGMVVETTALTGLDAVFDTGPRETPEQLNAIGRTQASVEERRRAAVEALLNCEAPVDYQTFRDHRVAASTAYDGYIRAHAEALRAYRAEEIVGELAAGTGSLAEQGGPVLAASESMAQPLQQSIGTEDRRTAIISGADSEVPQADSGLAGIVIELIAKLGDNSDEMDEQPNAGGAESGQQMADGQNVARDEASNRTDQVSQASEQNRQFLNEAVSLQSAQQENVAGNISALEARQQTELQIQDEIKAQKAGHLAERERQRGIVSENAAAFNSEFQQMDTWRQDYDAKKAAVESEFS